MPRIQQLSPHVVNKIAAGEVIERPASVVKELLENSVDALATRIDVDIVEGGMELIRVVDDGEGIDPQELPLAVASHATSKLSAEAGLTCFACRRLGFAEKPWRRSRIVSRFKILQPAARSADGAVELEVDLRHAQQRALPARPGGDDDRSPRSVCQARRCRRKFLKQPSTEFGHVSEQFTKIALAHPRLHLVLRHNDRVVYELPAAEKLLDRISLFFGADLAKQLIWVESEFETVRLWGYVGHPSQSKATRKGQYLFLNGRWIQDRSLGHALAEAYRGLLMVGRNPVTFLFLEMPADMVDVNVHPTKAEVRFRESQKLYRQLLVDDPARSSSMNLNSELQVRAGTSPAMMTAPTLQPVRSAIDPQKQQQLQQDLVAWARDQVRDWGKPGYEPMYPDLPPEEPALPETLPTFGESAGGLPGESFGESVGAVPMTNGADSRLEQAAGEIYSRVDTSHMPGPEPLAGTDRSLGSRCRNERLCRRASCRFTSQLSSGGLTVEGLQVVDQHALHERISNT